MAAWRVSNHQAFPKARDTKAEPHKSLSCSASIMCKHARIKRTTTCWSLCAKNQCISNATSGPNVVRPQLLKCRTLKHKVAPIIKSPSGASVTNPLQTRDPLPTPHNYAQRVTAKLKPDKQISLPVENYNI